MATNNANKLSTAQGTATGVSCVVISTSVQTATHHTINAKLPDLSVLTKFHES